MGLREEDGYGYAEEAGQPLQIGDRWLVGGGFPTGDRVCCRVHCLRQSLLTDGLAFRRSPQLPNLIRDLFVDTGHLCVHSFYPLSGYHYPISVDNRAEFV